ncbi:hypothetical protein AXG93_2381s1080 [Marchantia polymorpha subsp. ruderalis]|uniref:Uncharacterized protein n=1 Tax=Marchantia polymorpha subsp. ruderalis TaxID=1480154 RepID=A0A176VQ15_MARPO|nr:hypothetical protein AXG93_2381s1080 [Marchantia polymorpha subsp. ruderalis]
MTPEVDEGSCEHRDLLTWVADLFRASAQLVKSADPFRSTMETNVLNFTFLGSDFILVNAAIDSSQHTGSVTSKPEECQAEEQRDAPFPFEEWMAKLQHYGSCRCRSFTGAVEPTSQIELSNQY